MGETTSRIEQHIVEERNQLDRDLQQIERKFRTTAASLRRNTAVLAGLSVAAGVLLFVIVNRWTRAG